MNGPRESLQKDTRAGHAAGVLKLALIWTLSWAAPAGAQRAADNVVTEASDAFGTVVGAQTMGLYTPASARGFSPTQAENLRIEGLYFDLQPTSADPYLFSGSAMRVGISAQTFSFPAPSGIVDLKLRLPGDESTASAVLLRGPLDLASAEIDLQYPLESTGLSVGMTLAAVRNFEYNYAVTSARHAISLALRYRPGPGVQILPFFGYTHSGWQHGRPVVYADRVHPAPTFDQRQLPSQSWTPWGWNQITAGLIADLSLGGSWSLRSGVFRSAEVDSQNVTDLLLGLSPSGIANHVIDVAPARTWGSYSGDLRVTRTISSRSHQGELTFAIRSRSVNRRFGGDSIQQLGRISIHDNSVLPEPAVILAAQSRDVVRQTGFGVNYSERWNDLGSISLGVLATHYLRTLSGAGMTASTERTVEALPNVAMTVNALRPVTLYGSYTRGLEDSVSAPTSAVNRGESPPSTPTWQFDGGARFSLQSRLQLLVGGFEIHKAYFSLDTAERYRQLGGISARGLEASATWNGPEGLTVVAGGVWLRPEVTRDIPELGGSGRVPVGPVPRTLNVNIDYAPGQWRGWGATLQWTSLSSRVETADDAHSLPSLATVNVGARYLFKLFGHAVSARLDVINVTNGAGLTIAANYSLFPQLRRTYMLTLAGDR